MKGQAPAAWSPVLSGEEHGIARASAPQGTARLHTQQGTTVAFSHTCVIQEAGFR